MFALYQRDLMERERTENEEGGAPADLGETADPYEQRLIEGVLEHREAIDAELAAHLEGWTLDRLAPLERNILRVGLFELKWVADTPAAVAIDEAVTLAKRYCSDEAGRLVNGVLGSLSE